MEQQNRLQENGLIPNNLQTIEATQMNEPSHQQHEPEPVQPTYAEGNFVYFNFPNEKRKNHMKFKFLSQNKLKGK